MKDTAIPNHWLIKDTHNEIVTTVKGTKQQARAVADALQEDVYGPGLEPPIDVEPPEEKFISGVYDYDFQPVPQSGGPNEAGYRMARATAQTRSREFRKLFDHRFLAPHFLWIFSASGCMLAS